MTVRQIREDIWAVGAIDWNRRIFDELVPLPHGTSYNSYLVKGSAKTVLLDTVDPTRSDELMANLKVLEVTELDYVIAHHAEQDHSGSLPDIVKAFPKAVIVCSAKAKPMLIDHLQLPDDRFQTVGDGETLDLGDKILRFIMTPWVHWPETMVSYLEEDKILFSCDFFGAHLAVSDLTVEDSASVDHAAKTYYAEIMMPFRSKIAKHLEKLSDLDIEIIAPSHGPLRNDPRDIMSAYSQWVSAAVSNTVVIPYVSMHGSTQIMVDRLIDSLVLRGVTVKPFFLSRTDIGELANALVDAATVVIGTPTVLTGPHPLATNAANIVAAIRPKIRFASIVGSFGWGGKTVENLTAILSKLPVELIEPVLVKGYPREDALARIDVLADAIAAKHATF